jgi:glycosyltransferase involved in cell wall biosynthesis
VITRRQPGVSSRSQIGNISVFRAGFTSAGKLGAVSYGLHALYLLATRLRHVDLLHAQNFDTPVLAAMVGKLILGKPVVMTVHAHATVREKLQTFWGRLRLAVLRKYVDCFIVLTKAGERELTAIGVPHDRIRSISNPVDVERIRPPSSKERSVARRCVSIENKAVVCLFVGRLVPEKRVDRLIKAWSSRRLGLDPSSQVLLIVGDGPERARLERIARDVSAAGVRFEGQRSDVTPYLRAADVFALTSDTEGLPLALLEAMAGGLCPVVTKLAGYEGLVEDGVTGLLAELGDQRKLEECLVQAIRSKTLRERIGRAARGRIVSLSAVETVAQKHCELYSRLVTSI